MDSWVVVTKLVRSNKWRKDEKHLMRKKVVPAFKDNGFHISQLFPYLILQLILF